MIVGSLVLICCQGCQIINQRVVSEEVKTIISRADTLTPEMSHEEVLNHLDLCPIEVFHAGVITVVDITFDSVTYSLGSEYSLTINHYPPSKIFDEREFSSISITRRNGNSIFYKESDGAKWYIFSQKEKTTDKLTRN